MSLFRVLWGLCPVKQRMRGYPGEASLLDLFSNCEWARSNARPFTPTAVGPHTRNFGPPGRRRAAVPFPFYSWARFLAYGSRSHGSGQGARLPPRGAAPPPVRFAVPRRLERSVALCGPLLVSSAGDAG